MSIIPNFLAGFVQKVCIINIKLFNVTSVNFGFLLIVTILYNYLNYRHLQNFDEYWYFIAHIKTNRG